jgi:hypothetical protein
MYREGLEIASRRSSLVTKTKKGEKERRKKERKRRKRERERGRREEGRKEGRKERSLWCYVLSMISTQIWKKNLETKAL